jgi:hypothetical protein
MRLRKRRNEQVSKEAQESSTCVELFANDLATVGGKLAFVTSG